MVGWISSPSGDVCLDYWIQTALLPNTDAQDTFIKEFSFDPKFNPFVHIQIVAMVYFCYERPKNIPVARFAVNAIPRVYVCRNKN